jgi:dihydrofolate synthase/folylpolyglutamate synthase
MRTALYTSPHLVSMQERLRVDRKFVGIEIWRDAFRRVSEAVESDEILNSLRPTFFESITALCFLIMGESDVDIAVVEAGMGGRYDATSSCDALATVVTPIGLDHMEYLGDTLQAIASEKFAAVRRDVPAFYAADDETLMRQFTEKCAEVGAPSYSMSAMATCANIRCALDGTTFDYTGSAVFDNLRTPLVGIHQATNATNAISLLLALKKLKKIPNHFERIGEPEIRKGLLSVDWPGRMEVIRQGPGSPTLMLDGAHNEHAFRVLAASLRSLLDGGEIKRLSAVIFAVMRDKDITPILGHLKALGAPVFCTQPPTARAMTATNLAGFISGTGCVVGGAYEAPMEALDAAMASSGPGDLVLCCGSFYLVGAVKYEFLLRK